ncbi:DUF4168 domain-containing protein [Pigmentiphaga sp. H8]|uniref:DUF4168 domain-containing protein n=1 Tax=unclassified Pigmentiphaga TaxID=2626614 RepID=UPI000F5A1A8C|nr:DUF4168 domain-containing protein [Pigmentiphaga sp. H8]AZG07624.1 DUF4168 domain-containing protein [Pigmentiphaga sp. H8]
MKRSYVPAVGACLIAMASAAMAQAPQQAPAPDPSQGAMPAQPQPAANVSDDQLRKFVSAAQKVAMISQEYTPRLNSATDAASQQQVHKEADDKMVDAVHREGLTVDEFNGIGQAVEQNPSLAQRARDMAK